MSQPAKRGAEEAFGKDSADNKHKTGSKRRKERRKHSPKVAAVKGEQPVHSETQTQTQVSSATPSKATSPQKQNGTPAVKAREDTLLKTASPNDREEDGRDRGKQKSKGSKDGKKLAENQAQSLSPKKATGKSGKSQKDAAKIRGKNNSHVEKVEIKTNGEQADAPSKEKSTGKKKNKQKALSQRDSSKWSLSSPAGGAFIDHDPILTPDEQFLILATTKDIHIYATKTSLLVRTIFGATASSVVTYSQLPNSSQHLVVGFENGTIKKFDWTSGQRIWTKKLNNHIVSLTPTSSNDEGDSFLVVVKLQDDQTAITSLTVDYSGEQTGLRPMLSKSTLTGRVCFSAELGIAVVCTQDAILVGRLQDDGTKATLIWEEILVHNKIACFDARISPASQKHAKNKKVLGQAMVTVVTGLRTGEIHIYNDILNKKSDDNVVNPQRLHWHRSAPRTVKFSPDSKYLISGGDETVLVIWQLDTNQSQILPHLTSAILNITISDQGSAYAFRLADNSVMVLSTSDLKPFANVSGLAIDASSASFLPDSAVPAVLHSQNTTQLLLAYSSQSLTPGLKPAEKSLNMLQVYDTASGLQLSKQALARNLASTINIGGNGQLIHEPDVTHINISHDGNWLVTVDQWSPDHDDLDQLYLSRGDNVNRAVHVETFLRFWSTTASSSKDTSTSSWELNTRVDDPVSLDLSSSGGRPAILAIAVSPTRHQVAVADTTSHLKIYSPKARVKGGLPVKDTTGQQLFSWTCDHDIPFRGPSDSSDSRSATLVFSEDGSILAASWATTSDARARVYLIEPKSGVKIADLPDIVSAGRSHLAFSGQNLIALSSKFVVLDMVTTKTTHILNIVKDFPDNRFDTGKSKLAVNSRSGVAAIALSERDVQRASHVLLYDVRSGTITMPYQNGPIQATHKERIPGNVQILLSERDNGGFLIVDGDARIMRLSPPGSGVSTASAAFPLKAGVDGPLKTIENGTGTGRLENIFGHGRKAAVEAAGTVGDREGGADGVAGRVALEDVFRFERSSDVPGPMELFGRVAGVVGGA